MNGNFSIIISKNKEIYLITDRLSTKPLFYRIQGNEIIFTSKIRTLAKLNTDLSFDLDYLTEYLSLARVLGTKTPLQDVKQVPPATIAKFNSTGEIKYQRYWRPEYNPLNESYDYFVKRFHKAFEASIKERKSEDLDIGLMISGGFDSRLVASKISDSELFHINERMNKEAKIAKKVAAKTSNEFTFLKRDKRYYNKISEESSKQNNFYGSVRSDKVRGFIDDLSEKDILLSGQYSDTFLEQIYLPRKKIRLKYDFKLPFVDKPNSLEEYKDNYLKNKWINAKTGDKSHLVVHNRSMEEIFSENLFYRGNSIHSHGISYPDLKSLLTTSEFFPITNRNTYLFQEGLSDASVNRNPFLDNRIINLSLQLPLKYRIRKSLIQTELTNHHRALSKIKHGEYNFYPKSGLPRETLARFLKRVKRKFDMTDANNGPWADHEKKELEEDYKALKELGIFDREALSEIKDNEENYGIKYRLMTLSKMPITKMVNKEDEQTY